MKPLFWVAVNIIGFIILVFIYINTDKIHQKKSYIQKLFRYLQLLIMLYFIFDTGAYLLNGSQFKFALIINYIFNISYYLIVPVIGLIYLMYCDYKVYDNIPCSKKKLFFYSIPIIINTILILSTPVTQLIFYFDEHNMYIRGNYQWTAILMSFFYIIASYPLLAVKTKSKQALVPKGVNIFLYLFQLPPLISIFLQLSNYGSLILGMSFVISVFFMYISNMHSSDDKRRIAVRIININITQFAVTAFILIVGLLWTMEKLIGDISMDYVKSDLSSTAKVMDIILNKDTNDSLTEWEKITELVFAQYDNTNTRVIIIDDNGIILIDNTKKNSEKIIYDEVTDPNFIFSIKTYLNSINNNFSETKTNPLIININTGDYIYASITRIGFTNNSVVALFDSSSLFNQKNLLPPFIIIAFMFLIFIFSTNLITQRLIFHPLQLLVDSLLNMKKENNEEIYGTDRHDEIGLLSNTIHDLFIKGNHDGLTGIYNRHYLEQTLNQLTTALSRADTYLSVMMIDVDFFKKYNDSYGHTQGDECLKAIAKTLNKNIIRTLDFAARYGGEEFIVILPSTDEAGTRIMADKMLNAIRELEMPHKENPSGIVTISIGIASGNLNTQDYEKYINRADEALYISKNSGRNCCTFLSVES